MASRVKVSKKSQIAGSLHKHRRIGLDASVFIYHFEAASRYAAQAGTIFDELAAGSCLS